jgi:hypothetical protein
MLTRIVDGSGRLVEDLIIPIEVRFRQPGPQPRTLFEHCHALIRSACLTEVARRITALASEYGRGLERARSREAHLAQLAEADKAALIQPGLFDGRAVKERVAVQHDFRKAALDNASSLLVAQQSEAVLLLITREEK